MIASHYRGCRIEIRYVGAGYSGPSDGKRFSTSYRDDSITRVRAEHSKPNPLGDQLGQEATYMCAQTSCSHWGRGKLSLDDSNLDSCSR